MSQRTTCFRVEVQRSDGTWRYLFDADFPCALEAVDGFKRRGIKARFKGEGSRKSTRTAKRRDDYRAVR